MGQFIDRTGNRYGRLIVIERDVSHGPASHGRRVLWRCKCDCGAVAVRTGHELASGDTESCGCLRRELIGAKHRTHGKSWGPTYMSWMAMKARCYNPQAETYPRYGGVGIRVCDQWRDSFEQFLEDMGERPEGKTVDRIDNDGDYTSTNCRWATPKEQAANKRRPLPVWRDEFRSLAEIAKMEGVPRTSLGKHYRRIGDMQEAVLATQARLRWGGF